MTEQDGTASPGEGAGPEVEATLAVVSDSPGEVARRIASLRRAGPYPLRWRPAADLRDVYVDTPDGELRARGLALRLRREDGAWTLTLKGDARRVSGGAVERTEVEGGWSEEGAAPVAAEMEERGVDGGGLRSAAGTRRPVEALRAAGFRVVQDRKTARRRADVLPPGADGEGGEDPVAELCVDVVRFRGASGRTLVHREVEVEAAPASPPDLPGRIAGELREAFAGELRPWPHSKLATGRALAERDPPTGPGGDLRPGAYDGLDRRLAGADRGG